MTLVGATIGALVWNATVPISERIGLGRLRWFAEHVGVPMSVQVGLISLIVALAVIVSTTGSAPALADPLADRRSVPKALPRWGKLARVAPLVVGAALLAAAAVHPTPTTTWFVMFATGNALGGIGLFTAMPVLARRIGGLLADRSTIPSVRLAGRRLTHDPSAVAE